MLTLLLTVDSLDDSSSVTYFTRAILASKLGCQTNTTFISKVKKKKTQPSDFDVMGILFDCFPTFIQSLVLTVPTDMRGVRKCEN